MNVVMIVNLLDDNFNLRSERQIDSHSVYLIEIILVSMI